jgi:hypothetical protein
MTGRSFQILIEFRPISLDRLDAEGCPLPGFGHENSVAIARDKLRYRIVWRHDDNEKSLKDVPAETPAALKFILRNGDLFAFQVSD